MPQSNATVAPSQRYTAGRPCPICGGHGGRKPHCHGYTSEDGKFARCSSEQCAGDALLDERSVPPVFVHVRTDDGGYRPWTATPPRSAPPRAYNVNGRNLRMVERATPAEEAPKLTVVQTGPKPKTHATKPGKQYFAYGPTQRIERVNSVDANGEPIKKCFSQHHIDGAWKYGDGPDPIEFIYRRAEADARPEDTLHIFEGENCCDAALALDDRAMKRAIAWRGGTDRIAAAMEQIGQICTGQTVVLHTDADQPGRKATRAIADAIRPLALSVRWFDLFPDENPAKGGRDIEDWIAEGGTAEAYAKLLGWLPEYEPEAEIEAEQEGEAAPRVYATYTAEQMKERPAITFAIQGLLPEGSLASLVGAPGTYKSFIALDWAASIATRDFWQDRDVTRGGALYVSAEGASGLGQRIRAWETARNQAIPATFRVMTDAPQLRDTDDMLALLNTALAVQEAIGEPLRLIVIDTLARTFDGEENSSQEMGEAVRACDLLRKQTGAAVLIIHHLNKAGTGSRGSSALLGALDVELTATRNEHSVKIEVTKAKDFGEGEPIMLAARTVALEGGGTSLTLDAELPSADGMNAAWKNVAMVLHDQYGEIGATQSEWKRACEEMTFTTFAFNKARTALATKKYVTGPQGEKSTRGHRYRLTRAFYEFYRMEFPPWLGEAGANDERE